VEQELYSDAADDDEEYQRFRSHLIFHLSDAKCATTNGSHCNISGVYDLENTA
jgi:hypothetical protein